ncbi:hypothetical protein FQA47_006468 [Oryzias melastigma]|uniref:Uncharacterized protein n=1 Tax=Oryzias melastigma TaxID=30732 RepID=A0A834KXV2_ORYME|nr:hypothetical protein FQA47_006468 [Oryzias melastigma]
MNRTSDPAAGAPHLENPPPRVKERLWRSYSIFTDLGWGVGWAVFKPPHFSYWTSPPFKKYGSSGMCGKDWGVLRKNDQNLLSRMSHPEGM